jgi:hypothetical protein
MLRTLIEVSFDKIDDSNSSKLCLIAYPFSLQNPKSKFYGFNFRGIGYGADFRVQITYRRGMQRICRRATALADGAHQQSALREKALVLF